MSMSRTFSKKTEMRASLDKIHEKRDLVTNEFHFKIRGDVIRRLKGDLFRMNEQKENLEMEFLQGKWINSSNQKICVTGKKCIFLDKDLEFDIIVENDYFVMDNWICAKEQRRYSENGVIWTSTIWTNEYEQHVSWTRLDHKQEKEESPQQITNLANKVQTKGILGRLKDYFGE